MSADVKDVLDAVAARLASLSLTLEEGSLPIPVLVSKQPEQEESEEYNTQLTVCAAQKPKEVKRLTNLHDLHAYRAQVVLWTPGNQDRHANHEALAAIEDAIQQAFNDKSAELLALEGDLLDVRAETGVFLDRSAYSGGWDASATDVTVEIVRPR